MEIRIAVSRTELGQQAAHDIARELRARLATQLLVRMIFAAAPSQDATLASLLAETGIDWSRIVAFHMDEYIGLPEDAPQRFAAWLRSALFDSLPDVTFHSINPDHGAEPECRRYARLLAEAPIDIVLLGVGENGHLAFNDPPAVLSDPGIAKVVRLDEACRQQQVNDGCFPRLRDVPTHAITLTIPALLSGARLFCSIPGERKRTAITRMLHDPIGGACPATTLRTHPHCVVYLDRESAADLVGTSSSLSS